MKSLAKVFVVLLLAVTITFAGFNSYAHAAPINVIEVANKTRRCILRYGGVVNNLSSWPIREVRRDQVISQEVKSDSFSFASNYRIDCPLRTEAVNAQFSASLDTIGNARINATGFNTDARRAAEVALERMRDGDKKYVRNNPYEIRAEIVRNNEKSIWRYEVSEIDEFDF